MTAANQLFLGVEDVANWSKLLTAIDDILCIALIFYNMFLKNAFKIID